MRLRWFALALALCAIAVPAAAAEPAARPASETVEGRIRDPEGKPIAGAFVLQQGGAASAISDRAGRFSLKMDPGGQPVLLITAGGYLPLELANEQAAIVTLRPVPIYQPAFVPPPGPLAPLPVRPFDTELGMSYRTRYISSTARSRHVEGRAGHELAAHGTLRAEPWRMRLDGFRLKVPLVIGPLDAQPSPQPAVEAAHWSAWLGYTLGLGWVDVLPEIGYGSFRYVPTNAGTRWTGTPLDFDHSRQGIGLAASMARSFGKFDVGARAVLLPWLNTEPGAVPYALGEVRWTDVGLDIGYEILGGLRIGVEISRQWNTGSDLDEWANVVGFNIAYRPGRVRL